MTITNENIGLGTVPCDKDGNSVLNPTHVLLAIGEQEGVVLTPERAYWLSQALVGQLPAVGYKIDAMPINSIPVQKVHSNEPGFDKRRGHVVP